MTKKEIEAELYCIIKPTEYCKHCGDCMEDVLDENKIYVIKK